MGADTKIEWARHTFNPWIGCTKVSPACAHCYAESYAARYGRAEWGAGKPRSRTSAANWKKPLAWDREAKALGERPRVFCASLADCLDDDGVPIDWLADLLVLIHATPNLDWLLLTKRPENAEPRLMAACEALGASCRVSDEGAHRMVSEWLNGTAPANVWLGCTVENQEFANQRIPKLLRIPARVRFLSCEPLLGELNLTEWLGYPVHAGIAHHHRTGHVGGGWGAHYECEVCDFVVDAERGGNLHWIIAGGESGHLARPSHPDWFRSLRDQCALAGAAFFFKQWGEWLPASDSGDIMDRFWISNRRAAPHENQDVVDELDGKHPTVPLCVIQGSGAVVNSLDVMAFEQGKNGMMIMRVGKKAAGRLLNGREWNDVPLLCQTAPNPNSGTMT